LCYCKWLFGTSLSTKAFSSDAVRGNVRHMGPKRMRCHDEDFIRHVRQKASVGQASTGSVAHALGNVAKASAYDWSGVKELPAYIAALWMTLHASSVIGISYDGSRLGCPKEETVTYGVTNGSLGGWFRPKVMCHAPTPLPTITGG
jgi:hypothetical protein